jgi:hypothetical protein
MQVIVQVQSAEQVQRCSSGAAVVQQWCSSGAAVVQIWCRDSSGVGEEVQR